MVGRFNGFLKVLMVAAVAFYLGGCAGVGATRISKEDFAAIKAVSIAADVTAPVEPFIQGGNTTAAAMLGGGIGAAIENRSAGIAFADYLRRNNLDMRTIVKDSFSKAIAEKQIFPLAPNSDMTLRLQINTYGFGVAGMSPLSTNMRRPMLNVTASLVNKQGAIVWRKTGYITNMSKLTQEYAFDQLAANPKDTEASLKQAAAIVANEILADLAEK